MSFGDCQFLLEPPPNICIKAMKILMPSKNMLIASSIAVEPFPPCLRRAKSTKVNRVKTARVNQAKTVG